MELMVCAGLVGGTTDQSCLLPHLKMSVLHLSRATAIFVVDGCQFGPSWIFGLKMELMASADLDGVTTDQSCLFTDLTC